MRRTITFYPASAIRRVVHMMHACPTSGSSVCGPVDVDGGKRQKWRCKLMGNSSYVLNKYFHHVGRDSVP